MSRPGGPRTRGHETGMRGTIGSSLQTASWRPRIRGGSSRARTVNERASGPRSLQMKTATLSLALALALAAAGALADDGKAFATGNMSEAVKAMDTDHDGMVSEAEYLRYQEAQYDRMKDGAGTVADDAFATGNMSWRSRRWTPTTTAAFRVRSFSATSARASPR